MGKGWYALWFIGVLLVAGEVFAGPGDRPPERPETGYGSSQGYIASSYSTYETGSANTGDLTWYFVPDTLRYGQQSSVVVFLHGFAALYPSFYESHLEHLLRQGHIVIFPQFQKSTLLGFLLESGLFLRWTNPYGPGARLKASISS